MRDGRDVCCSIAARNGSFQKALNRWKRDNEAILPYLNDNRILMVKYEEIISKQQTEIDRVLDFIGVPAEPLIQSFNQSRITRGSEQEKPHFDSALTSFERHDRLRESQLAQKLYNSGSRWLTELGLRDRQLIKYRVNHLLKRFGYIKSADW